MGDRQEILNRARLHKRGERAAIKSKSTLSVTVSKIGYVDMRCGRMVRSFAAERTVLSEAEIERLRLIVQTLQRNQFGRHAERRDDNQLHSGFEDLEADLARA